MPRKKPRDKAKAKRMRSALLEVTSDDAFLDALVEAHSKENARAQLKANPKSHLQGKVAIPDEMNVEFTEDAGTWGVRLSFDEGERRASGVDIRTGQGKGPETDPSDRERYRRLQRELLNILTSDAYLDTVAEHEENEGKHAEFKADARAQLQAKGIRIPDEVEVEVSVSEVSNPYRQCCHYECHGWWLWRCCHWECHWVWYT